MHSANVDAGIRYVHQIISFHKIFLTEKRQNAEAHKHFGALGTNDPAEESAVELLKQVLTEE